MKILKTTNKQTNKEKSTNHNTSPLWSNQMLLSLSDVALFDQEVINFACLVDIDLDQRSGLCEAQPTLPSTLIQQGLLIFQVGPWHQPHHLT